MTNVLVASVFVVHLAVGAGCGGRCASRLRSGLLSERYAAVVYTRHASTSAASSPAVTDDGWLTKSSSVMPYSAAGAAAPRWRSRSHSMSESSLLFKIKTKSFMQRGADLQYLSAFPAEKELLYPPLTFLKPTGWKMGHAAGGVKYQVIEVEPQR